MLKSNITNTVPHNHSVPERCPRVTKLLEAYGETRFLEEVVAVYFPKWKIENIQQISSEQYKNLESHLEAAANEAGK